MTTTDIGRGYDEDALSLGSDERRGSHASQLQTMEEGETATRERLGGGASAAKVRLGFALGAVLYDIVGV